MIVVKYYGNIVPPGVMAEVPTALSYTPINVFNCYLVGFCSLKVPELLLTTPPLALSPATGRVASMGSCLLLFLYLHGQMLKIIFV